MTLSSSRLWRVLGVTALLLAATCPAPAFGQALGKWAPAATPASDYEAGGNPEAAHGSPDGAYIRSLSPTPTGTGDLRVVLPAAPYLGKRVRFSGFVRTEDVAIWAALSIRVEDADGVWLANDLMDGRLIKGSTGWRKYDLVVDVPATSATIRLRMAMYGAGKTWVDGVTLDVVGPEVALTDWPGKWSPFGFASGEYEIGGNPAAAHGSADSGHLRSKSGAAKEAGLGTWLVTTPFLGKRLRVSAYIRTENVGRAARLWVAVAGVRNATLDLDNMGDRPIRGTSDWKRYEAVVDVPRGATSVSYGLAVDGGGTAWIDGVTVEAVGPEVARTGGISWFPTGVNPEDYDMGGNPRVPHGADGGGYIRSRVDAPRTFGSWATTVPITSLLGKRMRLSGYVRTEVASHAAIWMRVDGPNNQTLSFDNMDNRPIVGTTGWKRYDLVLDVPPQATGVMFGIMLAGGGKAWIDGLEFVPVGPDVPSTNMLDPYDEYHAGRYAEAAKALAVLAKPLPDNYTPCFFYFLALHRSGRSDDARGYLNSITGAFPVQKWPGPVVQFYAGRVPEADVLKAAASADPRTDKEQRCEAYYYLGMAYLLKLGDVRAEGRAAASKAREYLEQCVATGVTSFVEYRAARAELERMKK